MIVVILGPPGSGKGTQSDILAEQHGFFHFDTGARLRAEIATGSDLGKRIASYTDEGHLVPLEIIAEMIKSFFAQSSADKILFDGFPRNLDQARVLTEALGSLDVPLDHAIYLHIDEDSLLERVINRRFCSKCGEIYNAVSRPPTTSGVCDKDNAPLFQRKDDTEEVFGERVRVYLDQTKPVLDYYREVGKLREVDGDRDIAEVTAEITAILGVG